MEKGTGAYRGKCFIQREALKTYRKKIGNELLIVIVRCLYGIMIFLFAFLLTFEINILTFYKSLRVPSKYMGKGRKYEFYIHKNTGTGLTNNEFMNYVKI